MGDPYRTPPAPPDPEVKIEARIALQILSYLERLVIDNRDFDLRLSECDHALRAALVRTMEAHRDPAVEAAATRRAERLTEMTATIAAGIWGRNDPVLDLGAADSKVIVAKLARATAELILEQEAVDVR
jgi:hypothetical protein